ncbi:hydrolase, HD family [Ligilactobacillus hayakitensis DSM 18933 = JCM 14209]|uniref:bis(5'-nucleosyl)-tetraphosphatase (symmetrical) n=1 Tax=Ligilactobacillus hayakitensis DSM 18933 = JCM 14209 TaxID=1423755 RepID=A0A0R1WL62_9LACO|nr:bis(5'-nucleosyl)-tetraphosphatase (symmetrical) YqeK [Ligilactobacillus hayakitensis]KRM18730.1 hydrolase, HD family [Ligilactobacillus hayakitensis DSM 18933 = JCM 14209]
MTNIVYTSNIYSGTRADLISKIKQAVSSKRFQHILGVEKSAIDLAQKNNYSLEKASIAALVHDYAKERTDQEFKEAILKFNLSSDLLNWNNFIWHGVVGAEFIKTELGIEDEEILNAVRRHTVGDIEMTTLDQIVYVADYIEEGRDFPGVKEARLIAAENLKAAVSFETKHTLQFLMENNKVIYPAAILTYNQWVAGK